MSRSVWKWNAVSAIALGAVALVGCTQSESVTTDNGFATTPAESSDVVADAGHDHGGWWCVEHGIPEGICTQCSSAAAAEFQEKGDWCEEHNRAESQCFICHPELEEQFIAQYEAKFGEKPAARTE